MSDRIVLTLTGPAPVLEAARAHEPFVTGEVLATTVAYADGDGAGGRQVVAPDGTTVAVAAAVTPARG